MLTNKSLYLLLICIIHLEFVTSLYFYIRETEKKCFSEDIPEDTLVVG